MNSRNWEKELQCSSQKGLIYILKRINRLNKNADYEPFENTKIWDI